MDREIIGHLLDHLRQAGMVFKLAREVTSACWGVHLVGESVFNYPTLAEAY